MTEAVIPSPVLVFAGGVALGAYQAGAFARLVLRAEPVWVLRVTAPGAWTPGSHRGTIRVETDDPRQPVIELPYEAEVS